MAWPEVRAELRRLLAEVDGIRSVHEFPPAGISAHDLPAAMIAAPAAVPTFMNAELQVTYTCRVAIAVANASADNRDVGPLFDAVREALIRRFGRAEFPLGGHGALLDPPSISEATDVNYGVGMLATFTIVTTETRA